jgi:hypothetical protein
LAAASVTGTRDGAGTGYLLLRLFPSCCVEKTKVGPTATERDHDAREQASF